MIGDLFFILRWWFVILIFGFSFLPLSNFIFNKFWDKGYIFSKTISLIVISYLTLVLGIFKILPFHTLSLFGLLIISFLVNFWFFGKKIKINWSAVIFEEILFLAVLISWSFVRAFRPDIEGLEKFMDFGFLNTILRTKYLPPTDMWYAGQPINYYYFGHLIFAIITKISQISSAITYNLSIASVCALSFVSSFSLVSNFIASVFSKKKNFTFIIIGALISSFLFCFGGNLHLTYKIGQTYFQQNKTTFDQKALLKSADKYWYPDATRFIGFDPDVKDKTIHEFPLYSFVVSDLHGHMNNIPIVILIIAFLFSILSVSKFSAMNWKLITGLAFLLSVAYMTNAWDFAVYGLLFAIAYFILSLNWRKTLVTGLAVLFLWYLFTLPFSLNFNPMIQGVNLSDSRSPFYQLFILYGGFWLIIFPYLLTIKKNKVKLVDKFVLSLIILATILVIIPEVIYLKDIYIFEHRRANTMFKLSYQAFILYSLVSGYIIIRMMSFLKNKKLFFFYKLLFLIIFSCQISYSYFAIKSFYNFPQYKGLWGLNFLQKKQPSNMFVVNWFNQNVSGQPVILEAAGDSYSDYNNISMSTGLPTVQGWIVHEWLWRGGYDLPKQRQEDVKAIYQSADKNLISSLLDKYQVEYIIVGPQEKSKYKNINENIFEALNFTKIISHQDINVYKR